MGFHQWMLPLMKAKQAIKIEAIKLITIVLLQIQIGYELIQQPPRRL